MNFYVTFRNSVVPFVTPGGAGEYTCAICRLFTAETPHPRLVRKKAWSLSVGVQHEGYPILFFLGCMCSVRYTLKLPAMPPAGLQQLGTYLALQLLPHSCL